MLTVLLAVIAGTTLAMLLLVAYGSYLFEENRTRVSRSGPDDAHRTRPLSGHTPAGEVQWRTVVDPVEAANRAQASKPFAAAYARAMTSASEDSRAA